MLPVIQITRDLPGSKVFSRIPYKVYEEAEGHGMNIYTDGWISIVIQCLGWLAIQSAEYD
jgi:hypothetical protein